MAIGGSYAVAQLPPSPPSQPLPANAALQISVFMK